MDEWPELDSSLVIIPTIAPFMVRYDSAVESQLACSDIVELLRSSGVNGLFLRPNNPVIEDPPIKSGLLIPAPDFSRMFLIKEILLLGERTDIETAVTDLDDEIEQLVNKSAHERSNICVILFASFHPAQMMSSLCNIEAIIAASLGEQIRVTVCTSLQEILSEIKSTTRDDCSTQPKPLLNLIELFKGKQDEYFEELEFCRKHPLKTFEIEDSDTLEDESSRKLVFVPDIEKLEGEIAHKLTGFGKSLLSRVENPVGVLLTGFSCQKFAPIADTSCLNDISEFDFVYYNNNFLTLLEVDFAFQNFECFDSIEMKLTHILSKTIPRMELLCYTFCKYFLRSEVESSFREIMRHFNVILYFPWLTAKQFKESWEKNLPQEHAMRELLESSENNIDKISLAFSDQKPKLYQISSKLAVEKAYHDLAAIFDPPHAPKNSNLDLLTSHMLKTHIKALESWNETSKMPKCLEKFYQIQSQTARIPHIRSLLLSAQFRILRDNGSHLILQGDQSCDMTRMLLAKSVAVSKENSVEQVIFCYSNRNAVFDCFLLRFDANKEPTVTNLQIDFKARYHLKSQLKIKSLS